MVLATFVGGLWRRPTLQFYQQHLILGELLKASQPSRVIMKCFCIAKAVSLPDIRKRERFLETLFLVTYFYRILDFFVPILPHRVPPEARPCPAARRGESVGGHDRVLSGRHWPPLQACWCLFFAPTQPCWIGVWGEGPAGILCLSGSPELEEHCLRYLPQEKRLPWPSTPGKRCLSRSQRPLAMRSQPWEVPGQGPLSTWLSPDWLAHQRALWEMMVWPWSGLLSTWTLIDNLHSEFWKYCRKSIRFHPHSHGSWFLLPTSLTLVLFHSHFWIFFHPSR